MNDTVNIPVHAAAIPFLKRQGVKYTRVLQPETVKGIERILLEVTPINIIEFGIAKQKYGASQMMNELGICKVDLIKAT